MEHRIKQLYALCLRGEGKQGVDGKVSELRQLITQALQEGYSRETVERWLEQAMLYHTVGGQER